ncbi:MAG: BMP family ABC transporter substrate-binding protein [Thermotogae bacterium]|nr:MAG: BMP family ABC transporter substrate-binding protein [Thermotogota bacterium]
MRKSLWAAVVLLLTILPVFGFKVIMVTDAGGLGDKSFNDGTWRGIQMVAEELGIETKVIQSYEQADYIPNLTKAAQEADVVLAVGFLMTDALAKVAPQFPNTYFVGIDFALENYPPNLITFVFKEQEIGFVAGYIAAAMTKSNMVGFTAGMPIPPVERYRVGFETGVKLYADLHGKNITVLKGYTQAFGDPKKFKDLAVSQFAQGADVILAGGPGVIETAMEHFTALAGTSDLVGLIDYYYETGKGFFAIGVDMDQDYMAPGAVLCSVLKGVDIAAYYGVKWAFEGTFNAGLKVLGMKEVGSILSPMKYTKGLVPTKVLAELEFLSSLVKKRELVIPDTQETFDAFVTPPIEFPF